MSTFIKFNNSEITDIIEWACKVPDKNVISKWQKTGSSENKKEKEWGNKIIKAHNNNQWTTKLGEGIVSTLLDILGKNPRKPIKINKYCPDIETDDAIYEVKTRNWTTSGTAGEKVYGVPYKYASIPRLYNKPLIIICIAYQEYELKYGNTPVFDITLESHPEQYELLEYYKTKKISYYKFSDLVMEYKTLRKLEKLSTN